MEFPLVSLMDVDLPLGDEFYHVLEHADVTFSLDEVLDISRSFPEYNNVKLVGDAAGVDVGVSLPTPAPGVVSLPTPAPVDVSLATSASPGPGTDTSLAAALDDLVATITLTPEMILTQPPSPGVVQPASVSLNPASPGMLQPPSPVMQPASPGTMLQPESLTMLQPASPGTMLQPASPGTMLQPASPGTMLQPASPGTMLQPESLTMLQPASPGTMLQPASPGTMLQPASPGTMLQPASPVDLLQIESMTLHAASPGVSINSSSSSQTSDPEFLQPESCVLVWPDQQQQALVEPVVSFTSGQDTTLAHTDTVPPNGPKKRGRKPKYPKGMAPPRRNRPRKPKVYEIEDPLLDPLQEKKRKNAINAKRHRDMQKMERKDLAQKLEVVMAERDNLQQLLNQMVQSQAILQQRLARAECRGIMGV